MNMVAYFANKVGGLFSSIDELNRLLFDRIDRGAALYISFLAHSTKISIQQLRALSGVRNMKSAQKFIADSSSLRGDLVKKTFRDAELLLAFFGETKDQAPGIVASRGDADTKQK